VAWISALEAIAVLEHVIRLRGGWEWIDLDAPHPEPRRVALPLAGGLPAARRSRLTRRFGCPPIDANRESLWLRLEHVWGLLAIELNGELIGCEHNAGEGIRIPLSNPLPRNKLVLVCCAIDLPGSLRGDARCWGEIALVVRSTRVD
jgi:hypothetical protein